MGAVPRSGCFKTKSMGSQIEGQTLPISAQLSSLPARPQK